MEKKLVSRNAKKFQIPKAQDERNIYICIILLQHTLLVINNDFMETGALGRTHVQLHVSGV